MSGGLFPNWEVDVSTTSSALPSQVRRDGLDGGVARVGLDDAILRDRFGEASCHGNTSDEGWMCMRSTVTVY